MDGIFLSLLAMLKGAVIKRKKKEGVSQSVSHVDILLLSSKGAKLNQTQKHVTHLAMALPVGSEEIPK